MNPPHMRLDARPCSVYYLRCVSGQTHMEIRQLASPVARWCQIAVQRGKGLMLAAKVPLHSGVVDGFYCRTGQKLCRLGHASIGVAVLRSMRGVRIARMACLVSRGHVLGHAEGAMKAPPHVTFDHIVDPTHLDPETPLGYEVDYRLFRYSKFSLPWLLFMLVCASSLWHCYRFD